MVGNSLEKEIFLLLYFLIAYKYRTFWNYDTIRLFVTQKKRINKLKKQKQSKFY
jgi:hypothetical protein